MKNDPLDWEERAHARDSKESRKERKRLSQKDRSKYKKTDIEKRKKQLPLSRTDLLHGRVLAISPDGILVDSEGKLYTCMLKGSLKKEQMRIKNLVAVGDFVQFEHIGETGSIVLVEERRSVLSRAEHLTRRKEQLIAVNIDQVLITAAILLPELKPPLIDRYIIAARRGRMEPILVINKIDFLKTAPAGKDIEKQRALFEELVPLYRSLGIAVYPVSAATGEGLEDLKKAMAGKSSVFSGQSGVGKSALINKLIGTNLRIGEVVEKTRKGSHTTTTTVLLPLDEGGFCIDTPGIRSFGLWDLAPSDIQEYFSEIAEHAKECRFSSCTHRSEPGCAVKIAVERGEISRLRFDSYCDLINEYVDHKNP